MPSLLTTAHSFLSYSHSKLLLHLSSPPTPISKESSDLLRKAVLIQNAMDSVDVLARSLEKEKRERERMEEEKKVKTVKRIEIKNWFEVIEEEDEDEEDEEEENVESSSSSTFSSPSLSTTTSTTSTTSEQQDQWFEETWQSLQADASPTTSSSELESESSESEGERVEVQVVAVSDTEDDDEEGEEEEEEEDDDISGFSLFPPLPSSSNTFTTNPIHVPSNHSRQEIYSQMPESPTLKPTVIFDKMYVEPSSSSSRKEIEAVAVAVIDSVEDIKEFEQRSTPRKKIIAIESFESFEDSEMPEFDSSNEDEEGEDDDDGPITPHQDLIDDFDSPSISSSSTSYKTKNNNNNNNNNNTKPKTNTGVFIRKDLDRSLNVEESGGGECVGCHGGCCSGVVDVGEDESIF